jgi:hypothetical protein
MQRAEIDDHSLTVSLSFTAPLALSSPLRLVISSRPAMLLYHISTSGTKKSTFLYMLKAPDQKKIETNFRKILFSVTAQ